MAILVLSKHELLTLSTYSRVRPDPLSPLTRLYADQVLGLNTVKLQEAVNEMLASNYIQKQEEGIFLAKELEPAFFILHRPERVIAFKRLSMADIHEIYFTIRSGFAAQYIVRFDGLFETLAYPFSIGSMLKWYDEELLKGLELSSGSLPAMDIRLTVDETILLYAIIHIYRQRVLAAKKGLSENETWIPILEIRNLKELPELKGLLLTAVTDADIGNYIGSNPNLDAVIQGLVSKKLLIASSGQITYTREAKTVLDPGKVLDGVIVKTFSNGKGSLLSINFVKNGYVLFSPYPDSIDYRLRTVGSSVSKNDILCGFLRQAGMDLPNQGASIATGVGKTASSAPKTPAFAPRTVQTPQFSQQAQSPAANGRVTGREAKEAPDAEEKRFCRQCGAKLRDGAAFCNSCGNRVNSVPAPQK